jgi:chloride channel 3/4/5
MPTWQQEYNYNPDVKQLSRNFNNYRTIDWQYERLHENKKYYDALKQRPTTRTTTTRTRTSTTATDTELLSPNIIELDERPGTQMSINTLNSAISIINEISTLQLIKSRIWTNFQIWIVLTIVGILIGTIASFLNILTEFLNNFKNEWTKFTILEFLIFTILSIIFGLIASFLCLKFEPNASGSGISEVKCIVSGFNRPEFLNLNTLIIKAISLPFTIASGLSVGKEGPSVHYASCVGNVIGRLIIPWFNESPLQLSDIITASAGSGVAVAFGSPIGGVLFSVEEISNNLRLSTLWKTFYTSLIAITTLQIWNPFGTGQIVMFQVKYNLDWLWNEIIWFIIIGIFGGLYGIIVIKWNIKYVSFRQKYLNNWKYSGLIEIFFLCLISSILGYWNLFMRFDMTKTMELLFDSCTNDNNNNNNDGKSNFICEISKNESIYNWIWIIFKLFYATIIRIILVCISYGSKVPCGIFVPSMTIGATFGKLIGLLVEELINDKNGIKSGTYAFLGAGAALSGITGLTFTVVVIMYELTGAIKYIIPTMITIISVRIVNEIFSNGFGGIADQMIKFNGMPFIDLKEDHEELIGGGGGSDDDTNYKVIDLMVPQVIGLDIKGMKIKDIKRILEFNKREYPLLLNKESIIGIIREENLKNIVKGINEVEEDSDAFIKFISNKKLSEIIKGEGEGEEEEEEEEDEEEEGEDGGKNFEELIEFEFCKIDKDTSVYTLFDLFVEIGIRLIYVYEEDRVIGVVNRKDLIKFENYQHFKHHGNVFVNEKDEIKFNKLLNLYNYIWSLIF